MFQTEEWCGKSREELAALHKARIRGAAKARRAAERVALAVSRVKSAERGPVIAPLDFNGQRVYRSGGVTLPFISILGRG